MKNDIHPTYQTATARCACGNSFETRSTIPEISVEICAACHPFYTGKQKLVDTAGRVDRFRERAAATTRLKETRTPRPKAASQDPSNDAGE
jgi:large subunit ribosomal protein L31